MFTFNKYDIITISKINDTITNLQYTDMRTHEIYKNDINLEKDIIVIDDYDLFCKYMEKIEIEKKSPTFTRFIDEFSRNDIIQISIPFDNFYRKSSSNIILELPKPILSHKHDPVNDLLERKIILLEKHIADNFVIPFISDITHSELLDDVTDDILLEEINKYAVTFCKEQYYIDNAHCFKIVEWYSENSSKCIMLYDELNEPVVKYGCNYLCFIENKMIKIMRIPIYELLNSMTITGKYHYTASQQHTSQTYSANSNLYESNKYICTSSKIFKLSIHIDINYTKELSKPYYQNIQSKSYYQKFVRTDKSYRSESESNYLGGTIENLEYYKNNIMSNGWKFVDNYRKMSYDYKE